MARVNFELKDSVHKRFLERCNRDGRTVSDVLRALILDFIEARAREDLVPARDEGDDD